MFLLHIYFLYLCKVLKIRKQTYSLLLLGIFLISFGLRSVHFLEHQNEDIAVHKCENHNHSHDSEDSHDCSLCDFTLSSFTEFEFFTFEPFVSKSFNTQINTEYNGYLSTSEYRFFSLRAPPLV